MDSKKIEGYEVSGTVEHVGWWSPTIIRDEDREAIHIPNHKLTVNVVRNLSQKTHWRIRTHLAISHLDVNKINNIVADMRKVLAKNPQVEQQRLHRRVFLENINPENQALLILISCFVMTSHFEEYLCVKEGILLSLLRVIRHHHARLATPIRTVQKIYSDADIENIPFAETIFSRVGVNKTRPFLLIEPSSKVDSDDKAKARSCRSNEENDIKQQSPEPKAASSDSAAQNSSENKKGSKKLKETSKIDEASATNAPTTSTASQPAKATAGSDSTSNAKDGTRVNTPEKSLVSNTDINRDKVDGSTSSGSVLHAKPEVEKASVLYTPTARSALEENIVLGVALEGSKRVLPIEEEIEPRDDEGHGTIITNAATSDLREQDR